MKNFIVLLLFLNLSSLGKTQVPDTAPWCPDGATWVYRKNSSIFVDYSVYSYIKDTIIQGFSSKVIKATEISVAVQSPTNPNTVRFVTDSSFHYLRESNDSLYVYYENVFVFMYKFNSQVGDVFITNKQSDNILCDLIPDNFYSNDTLFVNGIDNSFVRNGMNFQRAFVSSLNRWDYGTIINKIGGDRSFFSRPSAGSCYLGTGYIELLCYSDNIRGFLKIKGDASVDLTELCEYVTVSVDDQLLSTSKNDNWIIYPNPSSFSIELKNINSSEKVEYSILDISLKEVCPKKQVINNVIDISNINAGIYFLILSQNRTSKSFKIIIL